MSASIHWHPRYTGDKCLTVGAPSHFIQVMNDVFGMYPWMLGIGRVAVLRGMAALSDDGAGNPYAEMIDAIAANGDIEVYPEY